MPLSTPKSSASLNARAAIRLKYNMTLEETSSLRILPPSTSKDQSTRIWESTRSFRRAFPGNGTHIPLQICAN